MFFYATQFCFYTEKRKGIKLHEREKESKYNKKKKKERKKEKKNYIKRNRIGRLIEHLIGIHI